LIHTTQHSDSFTDLRSAYGDLLLKGNCIVASTVLMKGTVVKKVGGFRTDLRYTHDLDYWIRISKEHRMGYVNAPAVYYRMNVGDGSSLQIRKTFREIRLLLNEHRNEYRSSMTLRALLFQTKFHYVQSRRLTSIRQSIAILLDGAASLFLYLFTRRTA
jgi:GT2 family glycosyltransferase